MITLAYRLTRSTIIYILCGFIPSHPILRQLYERCGPVTSPPVMVPSWGHNPLLPFTAPCFHRLNEMSAQASPRDGSSASLENIFSGMAVDKVEQLMLLRLNKQLIPEIASLREAEVEINARTQSRKKAVTDKVNAREATVATAPGAVGASNSSIAPTGTAATAQAR